MEKKRKVDNECRKFNEQWEQQYFVIESRERALCVICNETISVLKEYNINRHYKTKHSEKYSKFTGTQRLEKLNSLKTAFKSQQLVFKKVNNEQEAATRASIRVAHLIAKLGKPFADGELVKDCMIAAAEEMCPDNIKSFKSISLSANTVARRVTDIAKNLSNQLCEKNQYLEWFSLALDESTDVSDTAQVLIFIRGININYEIYEELLDVHSIHGTTTGEDIFKGVESAVEKNRLKWKNLKCITTDGGRNMCGKNKGVVGFILKAVENDGGSKPLIVHCIIHQQSLCGKCLDMSEILKPVMQVVNYIRSHALNHRQFREFIEEIGENDLPYYNSVRWLSCGKVLSRFFELREIIEMFLTEKNRPMPELQNSVWLWKLAFYTDLTHLMNELNIKLQGEDQLLSDMFVHIKAFRQKLNLFKLQLSKTCFTHFKTCSKFCQQTNTPFPVHFAVEALSKLKINFESRFSDFDEYENDIQIFQNPFRVDIEALPPELQMEVIELKANDTFVEKFKTLSLLDFYKSLPSSQFQQLHKFALGFFSAFGSTYLCEKTFSKMKFTKNLYRSNLTDEHLKSQLIISTSKINIQMEKIVNEKRQLHKSH